MLDFPEPYLLAPSSLTPTALRERAAAILADPGVLDPAKLAALPVGGAVELRGNFLYDAWLVRLGPRAASDLHAHERGYSAVAVVSGALRETRATLDGLYVRTVAAGEMISTRPGDTHRLTVAEVADDNNNRFTDATGPSVGGGAGTVALYLTSPPRGDAPRIVTSATATPVVPAAMVS
jgi:quercetin dioxygenase-like cupin family protein